MACPMRQLLQPTRGGSHIRLSTPLLSGSCSPVVFFTNGDSTSNAKRFCRLNENCGHRNLTLAIKSSPQSDGFMPAEFDNEDGVSLGTMKLPLDTDLTRIETLLFQWANSLCQGANLPLPVPLKVDKIQGGARLGFITIEDGNTEVPVYIDCLVFPATAGSGPIFRAIRNGPQKDKTPPGEPRIMRSLLQALQKSVEIARL